MTPRTDDARILADGLFARIAGDFTKTRIDVDDGAVNMGQHDAFAGIVKNTGQQFETIFGHPSGRHVDQHRAGTALPIVLNCRAAGFDIDGAPLEGQHPYSCRLDLAAIRPHAFNATAYQRTGIRMHKIERRVADNIVDLCCAQQGKQFSVDVKDDSVPLYEHRHRRILSY